MAFEYGGEATRADATFMSTQTLIKIDQEGELNKIYGTQRLSGIAELFGMRKPSTSQNYYWWEQNRIQPKIKATAVGAGAGAGATFTLDASSYGTVTFNTPSMYNSTVTKNNLPVRANDIIAVRPSSGVASASTLVKCIVYSVNATAKTFVAYPLDGTKSIPTISTAQEIIIYTNGHGEGSVQPLGMQTRVTKRGNNVQIIKENYKITGTADALKDYFTYNGSPYYRVMGEDDTNTRFENLKEMGLLYSDNLVNATYQDLVANAGNPTMTTQGLIPGIIERGNIYNYTPIIGMTVADFEDLAVTMNTQKAAKKNLLLPGIELNIDIDREFRAEFKNGGVVYGDFTMSEEKAVDLMFSQFTVGGFSFVKKCFEPFSDQQTFGADGYNFTKEGLIVPFEKMNDAKTGEKIDPLTIRYLEGKTTSRNRIEAVDLFTKGDTGEDAMEIRYIDELGLQAPGMNRFVYIKQA